jgi:hypothetical protein
MLSVELKSQPDELEIVLDHEGLSTLLAQLEFLEDGRTDHVHLMSSSWGGVHLDDQPQNPENQTIHHVKILMR